MKPASNAIPIIKPIIQPQLRTVLVLLPLLLEVDILVVGMLPGLRRFTAVVPGMLLAFLIVFSGCRQGSLCHEPVTDGSQGRVRFLDRLKGVLGL
jgi:hypothetical protein